jgi:hypothetical protein
VDPAQRPQGSGSPHGDGPSGPAMSPWLRAGLFENAGLDPDGPSPWGDPEPWGR